MGRNLEVVYAEILKISQSGNLGTPQVCICSVNTSSEEIEHRLALDLKLISEIFKNEKLKNESVEFIDEPYKHGFVSREFENGNLARCTYTAAPIAESVAFTVYGTDGELRYDTKNGEILVYKQIPDDIGEVRDI